MLPPRSPVLALAALACLSAVPAADADAAELSMYAVGKSDRDQKFLGTIIDLLLRLFGPGGITALFANKAADDAAEKVKEDARKEVDRTQGGR
jgi:hypothetical protein